VKANLMRGTALERAYGATQRRKPRRENPKDGIGMKQAQ
jgi:hypothetical protein